MKPGAAWVSGGVPSWAMLLLFFWLARAAGQERPGGGMPLAEDLGEAYRLLDAGQLPQAESQFRAVLAEDPLNLLAHEGLVWTYLKSGQPERAAREADKRLALTPKDVVRRKKWIEVVGQVPARRAEAVATARALARERPHDVEVHILLAKLLSTEDQGLPEAVEAYRKAVALAPHNPALRRDLARVLTWTGQYAEAGAEYRAVVELAPRDRESRGELARTLSSAGQSREAIRLFDALIAEDPSDAEALFGRALIARWNGDFETARRFLEQAAAAKPKSWEVEAELREIVKRAAEVRAARMDVTLPLLFSLIGACIVVGYTSRRITSWTYAFIIAYTAGLVCLALVWLYLPPWW